MREVLKRLVEGRISVEEAERLLKATALEEISGLAKLDLNREARRGIPEVILAEGKRGEDVAKIALRLLDERGRAIVSRVMEEHLEALRKSSPPEARMEVNGEANIATLRKEGFQVEKTGGRVGILTAGTSDIPVAEEARVIAEEMGCETIIAYDVGVAGIHRLFPPLKEMVSKDVDVIVVVAGREGALASVVAGMVDLPIIGVPTSTGYGFGRRGVGALTAMLQACPLGLAVVNIDGGVAAGALAALIANRVARARGRK